MSDVVEDGRFPRSVRLRRPPEFKAVYAGRISVAAGPLVLYGLPRPAAAMASRLGLSVSRRVGNAVVRNKWKRRLRDVFRRLRQRLPTGLDLVVVVRAVGPPAAGAAGAGAIERLLLDLVGRLVRKSANEQQVRRRLGENVPIEILQASSREAPRGQPR